MEVVNDSSLMELVRGPARELLPAAHRTSVVRPLVVLLAFMPGLLGSWNHALDETTCRHGLLALDVAAEERPVDWFVTASRQRQDSSFPASPLATLLTAASLRIDLISPKSRLLLVSYLSSVLLLLSLGGLATKVGGHRFALLVVGLACAHREFLALSESLPPVTLPLACAALSFRALLNHQSAGGAIVSWSLLASSMALAACWLTGGELAIASWCVLFVSSFLRGLFQSDSSVRRSLGREIRQRILNLIVALLSLLVVASLTLAFVVGWQSAFTERIHLPNVSECSIWIRRIWPIETPMAEVTRGLFQTTGAWLGFTLLGVLQLVRVRMSQRDRASTLGAWFLVSWAFVAGMSWWASWRVHHGELANSSAWAGFLIVPILFLSAWGLDAVLRREFGMWSVVTATLVTLAVVTAPHWIVRLPSSFTGSWFVASVLTGAIAVWAGLSLARTAAGSDAQIRRVIVSCVFLLVAADVTSGIVARRGLADDERELLAFGQQLIAENRPEECWLMTEETAPARLQFFLRSMWLRVAVRETNAWETVLVDSPPASIARPVVSSKARVIVVTWGSSKLPAEDLKRRGHALMQVTAPHYFQGRLLKAYRWTERAERPASL